MSKQMDFFPAPDRLEIPGATYVTEFISPEEEGVLIERIEQGVWTNEFSRRRQHYGIAYEKPDWRHPSALPDWIEEIARRIVSAGLFPKMPVQALVNEYRPGQGISAHKDYTPFDDVASLSLASGCLMEFRKADLLRSLWLEPRSLIVLTGEARHQWTHAIRPRLADVVHGTRIPRQRRLSLTLRTVRA